MIKEFFGGFGIEANTLTGKSFKPDVKKSSSADEGENLPSLPASFLSFVVDFMVLLPPRIVVLLLGSLVIEPFRVQFIDEYNHFFGPINNFNMTDSLQRKFLLTSNFALMFAMMLGIMWIMGFMYQIAMLKSKWQATVGKRMLSIYMTKINNMQLTLIDIISRTILSYVPYLLPVILLIVWRTHFILGIAIGILLFSWNRFSVFAPKKRALHDIICGTTMVYGKLN